MNQKVQILSRRELIMEMRRVLGMNERRAAQVLTLIFKTTRGALQTGDEVFISGFGRLSLSTTQGRRYRDRKTGLMKTKKPVKSGVFEPGRWAK